MFIFPNHTLNECATLRQVMVLLPTFHLKSLQEWWAWHAFMTCFPCNCVPSAQPETKHQLLAGYTALCGWLGVSTCDASYQSWRKQVWGLQGTSALNRDLAHTRASFVKSLSSANLASSSTHTAPHWQWNWFWQLVVPPAASPLLTHVRFCQTSLLSQTVVRTFQRVACRC